MKKIITQEQIDAIIEALGKSTIPANLFVEIGTMFVNLPAAEEIAVQNNAEKSNG